MSVLCIVNGCAKRRHYSTGYCPKHYQRIKRLGSVDEPCRLSDAQRLVALFTPEPFSGCWLWTGATDEYGYGQLSRHVNKKRINLKAHRFSYQLHKGPIPDGLKILHSCDTPLCINPAHLRAGTDKENKADSIARGRHAFGEKLGRAKLTEDQVLEMRRIYASRHRVNKSALARQYNISHSVVRAVTSGKTWRHLLGC